MRIHPAIAFGLLRLSSVRSFLLQTAMAVVALVLFLSTSRARAQELPPESYGPYNAVFLPDGPGLVKQLAAPSPLDSRTAALLDRLGLNKKPDQRDVLLEGRASWTLDFWFHVSEPLQGAMLIAGIGDAAAEDARFVGVQDGRLALWLGRGAGAAKLIAADNRLSPIQWHFVALASDGRKVTLYSEGKPVLARPLAQGDVAGRLEMAPFVIEGGRRLPQLSCDRQIVPHRIHRESIGEYRHGQSSSAGLAGARGGVLRNRSGAVHAIVVSGGVTLSAGGHPVAARSFGAGACSGQIGYFSGPHAAGLGSAAAAAASVMQERSRPEVSSLARDTFCNTRDLGVARAYKDLGSHRGVVSCRKNQCWVYDLEEVAGWLAVNCRLLRLKTLAFVSTLPILKYSSFGSALDPDLRLYGGLRPMIDGIIGWRSDSIHTRKIWNRQ